MKRFFLFLPAFLFFSSTFSQVILDASLVPESGTTIIVKNLQDPASFVFQKTGTNLIWDFTTQSVDSQDTLYYVDPASTPYAGQFPGATLGLQQSPDELAFIQNSVTNSLLLGVVADTGSGILVIPLQPTLTLFQFPYTYGDEINSTAKTTLKGTGSQFGMPFDSVKMVTTIITQRMVNAWGNLILLHGQYPGTLLEKGITKQVDSAWVKVPFLGWIPALGFPQTNVDTAYRWFTDELLHPFAEIDSDETGIYAGYFYSGNLTGIQEKTPWEEAVLIYPNPARTTLNIQFEEAQPQTRIQITDLTGKIWLESYMEGKTSLLNINHIPEGVFVINISGPQIQYSSRILIR